MAESNISGNIFAPKTMSELLSIKQQHPDTLLWAGGTAIMRQQTADIPEFTTDIIQLSGVEELKRIRRTERYLEIGACVPVKKILNVGQHVLPFALSQSLRSIGPPHVRNRATLGGNLSCRTRRLNTFSVLLLMDTIVELRKSGKSRWIKISRLYNKFGKDQINDNEVMTRIRIPLGNWDLQYFTAVGDTLLDPMNAISFTVLIETSKGILSGVKFAVGNVGRSILQSIDFESYLSGKKLRLNAKEIDTAASYFTNYMNTAEGEITPFQKDRTIRFIHWFLHELRDMNLFTE